MSVSTVWPGIPTGEQTLVSDALQINEINIAFQTITGLMLGISPEEVFPAARLDWVPGSQPAWGIGDDVFFIRCTLVDDPYDKVRNRSLNPIADSSPPQFQDSQQYIRVWRIAWTHYGPNSFDNARIVRDALFSDYYTGVLGQGLYQSPGYGLFLTNELSPIVRAPERFAAQWWERVDHWAQYNELVTSTITPINSIGSVAVEVTDGDATAPLEVEFTVPPSA